MDRFTLGIDDDALRDLRERLAAAAARRPRPGEGSARRRGEAVGDDLAALDPHRVAADLNRLPQWTIRIDGAHIHFVHERSERRARGLAGRATGLDRRQGRRVGPRRGPARGAAPPRPATWPACCSSGSPARRRRPRTSSTRSTGAVSPTPQPSPPRARRSGCSWRPRTSRSGAAPSRATRSCAGPTSTTGATSRRSSSPTTSSRTCGLVDWVRLSAPRRRGTGSTPSVRPERSSWVPRAPRCAGRRRP